MLNLTLYSRIQNTVRCTSKMIFTDACSMHVLCGRFDRHRVIQTQGITSKKCTCVGKSLQTTAIAGSQNISLISRSIICDQVMSKRGKGFSPFCCIVASIFNELLPRKVLARDVIWIACGNSIIVGSSMFVRKGNNHGNVAPFGW